MQKTMFHLLKLVVSAALKINPVWLCFFSLHLRRRGFIVINCPSDADATIVKNALHYAKLNSGTVIIVADDTKVAVMLVHHWDVAMLDVYFLEERWNKA